MSNPQPVQDRFDWNDKQIGKLRQLWVATNADGRPQFSASEIATLIHTSKNSVVGKAHRLKLPSRPSPIRATQPSSRTQMRAQRTEQRKAMHAEREARQREVDAQRAEVARVDAIAAVFRKAREAEEAAIMRGVIATARTSAVTRTGCDWPGAAMHVYCGEPKVVGRSYCSACCQRAYQPAQRVVA